MATLNQDLTRSERSAILGTAVLGMLLLFAAGAKADPGPLSLKVTPSLPRVGDPVLIEVRGDPEVHTVSVLFLGHVVPLSAVGDGRFRGLAPVGLKVKPGNRQLRIMSWQGRKGERRIMTVKVRVTGRNFDREALSVAAKFTAPKPRGLKGRLKRERRELKRVWRSSNHEPLYTQRFLQPLRTPITGKFGTQRLFNGKLKSRHRGVDLDGFGGEPVAAANAGRVVLAQDLFYSGNTVILDHGAGVFTLYYHLSQIDVRAGQRVEGGETLGAVGATGRVTGPHLHFAAKVRGTYVDPLRLCDLPLGDGELDAVALR